MAAHEKAAIQQKQDRRAARIDRDDAILKASREAVERSRRLLADTEHLVSAIPGSIPGRIADPSSE